MASLLTHSAAATEALGEVWGKTVQRGWIIGLVGELGAGKTQLVKGLARGLGVTECVQSPTFTLIHAHRSGRLPLYHLDLYRLETVEQILGAGLDEYLCNPPGVTVVEWAERWPRYFPGPNAIYRHVRLEYLSENDRQIRYEDIGV